MKINKWNLITTSGLTRRSAELDHSVQLLLKAVHDEICHCILAIAAESFRSARDCLPSISQGGETSSPNPLFNHPQIPSSIFRSLFRFKIKFIFSCSAWVCLGLDLEIYEEHLLCACWHFRVSIPRGSIHKAAVCWEAGERQTGEWAHIAAQHPHPGNQSKHQETEEISGIRVAHCT